MVEAAERGDFAAARAIHERHHAADADQFRRVQSGPGKPRWPRWGCSKNLSAADGRAAAGIEGEDPQGAEATRSRRQARVRRVALDRRRTELERGSDSADPRARRHRLHDRHEKAKAGAGWPITCAISASPSPSSRSTISLQRSGDPRHARRSSSRRTSIVCRRSFPAASRATASTAAGPATPRAFWPRRLPPSNGFGARARRASACCSSSARSAAATAPSSPTPPPNGCQFLIDGEPTESRLGLATRGMLRLKLQASGRAAHSSFPELGESAIDKLIDALVDLRSIELPADPMLGRTHYTVGLISGGVAPNVVSPSAEAEVMFRTVSATARNPPRACAARIARARSSTCWKRHPCV